tara:strand:- start:111 stop:950 length:840 start_codon:yes stop_codon:yes gene_type:complete
MNCLVKIKSQIFKGLLSFLFIISASAQETPLSEIFFLDLGIVIEPEKGNESYSRLVSKPSEEVTFKIKKVESGSVFMSSSKELLATLDRINDRISKLEESFQTELGYLRDENKSLRESLASISLPRGNQLQPVISIQTPLKSFISQKENKPVPQFDKSAYMSGVFAYQKEDYKMALTYFTSVNINLAPEKTAENILYWMADAYQQSADYETALSLLNQITETGKRRIDDALIQKGLLHRKMGQEDLAIAAFQDVVSLYPESEYLRLAKMELKKSDGMIQ